MTNHPRSHGAGFAKRSKSPKRKDSASHTSSSQTSTGSRKQEVERAYVWLKAQYESGRFKKAPMKDFADGLAQLLATYHREATDTV